MLLLILEEMMVLLQRLLNLDMEMLLYKLITLAMETQKVVTIRVVLF